MTFEGKNEKGKASEKFEQAWNLSRNDFEKFTDEYTNMTKKALKVDLNELAKPKGNKESPILQFDFVPACMPLCPCTLLIKKKTNRDSA